MEKFALNTLFLWVAGYAAILLVSMACTYFQAVILQKTGQKIISNMREDLFVHIERLSHEQLNEIRSEACHENDKRYERDFADVHQPSGQSSEELLRDHRYSDCDAVSEL